MSELQRIINAAGTDKASRANAEKNIPLIIEAAQRYGITDRAQLAYILATAEHESGLRPITEIWGPTEDQRGYEGRKDLGNNQPGDGFTFRGRGYVQITGRDRYDAWSKALGVDLVNNPDLALDPKNAVRILVQGMKDGGFRPVAPGAVEGGYRLGQFIHEGGKVDFYGARNIINFPVRSQASDVEMRANRYYDVLRTVDLGKLYSEVSPDTKLSPPNTTPNIPTQPPQSASEAFRLAVNNHIKNATDLKPETVKAALLAGRQAALAIDPNITQEQLLAWGEDFMKALPQISDQLRRPLDTTTVTPAPIQQQR
jgi:hypothetical protein